MSRVLFLHQPTVGHMNTLRHIALHMQAEGHTVHFLIPGLQAVKTSVTILDTAFSIPNILQRDGLSVDMMRPAPSTVFGGLMLPYKSGYEEVAHAIKIFAYGLPQYSRNIVSFIETWRPDVLVADFAFPATSLAAELTDTPYAVIYHSGLPFRGEGIPPFGSGLPIGKANPETLASYHRQETQVLETLKERVNQARKKLGLPLSTNDILRRPYSPWLNLVASAEVAEAPRNNLTETTLYIGPCFVKRPAAATDFPFDKLEADKFKVYVSLGTVFNNKPDVFKKIMQALDTPDYQVIISAGGAYRTLQSDTVPANVMLFERVPQVELLPQIDLFITHGGNNSTNEALASGKPLLVMPVGGEQGDNASRVEYLGVGLRLDIKHFTPDEVRTKVARIRADDSFQVRVEQVMQGLSATDGLSTASQCIDWVARHQRPLQRPAEMPVTITPAELPELLGN